MLPENQPYDKIYKSLDGLLNDFNSKDWIISYLIWEINLIKNLGFGFTIDKKNFSNTRDKKIFNIELDNINYKIPSFLIFEDFKNTNISDIYVGLNFSRSLIENKFFIPNNIRFPYSRKLLENNFL